MEKQTYLGIPHSKLFIPILVTNADLVSCIVHAKGIDLSTGEISDEGAVEFVRVNRVAYYFPLPEELYFYPQDVTGDKHIQFLMSASQLQIFKKLFIVVVRSSDFTSFLARSKGMHTKCGLASSLRSRMLGCANTINILRVCGVCSQSVLERDLRRGQF